MALREAAGWGSLSLHSTVVSWMSKWKLFLPGPLLPPQLISRLFESIRSQWMVNP